MKERKGEGEEGRKGMQLEEEGKAMGKKGEGSKGKGKKEIKLKNGRAGKEIKSVATLYTPVKKPCILFLQLNLIGRGELVFAGPLVNPIQSLPNRTHSSEKKH